MVEEWVISVVVNAVMAQGVMVEVVIAGEEEAVFVQVFPWRLKVGVVVSIFRG